MQKNEYIKQTINLIESINSDNLEAIKLFGCDHLIGGAS